MKITNVGNAYLNNMVKISLNPMEDAYYYEYLLEELSNISELRGEVHSDDDNNSILGLLMSNSFWIMALNDFEKNENIVISNIIDGPESIIKQSSSMIHANDKNLKITVVDEDFHVLEVDEKLLEEYDFFLRTHIPEMDSLFDNILEGEPVDLYLIGGLAKEKFISMNTKTLYLEDFLDVKQVKTMLELQKGIE